MNSEQKNIIDMHPDEIWIALRRKHKKPNQIAKKLKVSSAAISRVMQGQSVSDRISRAIAKAAGISVEQIWPSIYLYGRRKRSSL